jgi:hypothetical protein
MAKLSISFRNVVHGNSNVSIPKSGYGVSGFSAAEPLENKNLTEISESGGYEVAVTVAFVTSSNVMEEAKLVIPVKFTDTDGSEARPK